METITLSAESPLQLSPYSEHSCLYFLHPRDNSTGESNRDRTRRVHTIDPSTPFWDDPLQHKEVFVYRRTHLQALRCKCTTLQLASPP